MAEDFEEFDEFDQDVTEALEAEEQEDNKQAAPPVKKAAPQPTARRVAPQAQAAPAPQQPMASQRRMARPPAPQPKQVPQERFTAFTSPQRYGVIDNNTGQVHLENEDPVRLLLALIVEIRNDIEELRESI